MEEQTIPNLETTQLIDKPKTISEEVLSSLRERYVTTIAMAENQPHEAVLRAEGIVRDIFQALYEKKTGSAPNNLSMSEVFLAVRDMVPHFVQVELETVGFAYHHAMHSPMVRLTADSDYLIAGMEGLEIIFEWFDTSQTLPIDNDKDGVSATMKTKSVPLFKAPGMTFELLDERLEKNPSDVNALLNRGVLYNNEGRVMPAIKDFDAVVELDASVAEVYFHRGNSYQLLGDYEEALLNYQTALDLNMESAALYHARGMVYYKTENVGQAYVNFDLAMAIERRYAESRRHKKQLKKAKRFSFFKRN